MRKVSEHGEHVYLEFIRRKVELEYVLVFRSSVLIPINAFLSKQYPYVFPEEPPPAAIHVSSEPAPSDYSQILAARGFESKEVMNIPRVSLQEADLIQYQSRPELLQKFRERPSMKLKQSAKSFAFRRLLLQIKKESFSRRGSRSGGFYQRRFV